MRIGMMLGLAAALAGGVAWGDVQVIQPGVMAPPAAAQRVDGKIIVFRFDSVGGNTKNDWIGTAVQQNIVTTLGMTRGVQISANGAHGENAGLDGASAARMGKAADAHAVIFGSYQMVGNYVRILAQVVEAGSGRLLGAAKATGPEEALLKVEDDVVEQLRGAITGSLPAQAVGAPQQPGAAQQVIVPQAPGVATTGGGGGAPVTIIIMPQAPQMGPQYWPPATNTNYPDVSNTTDYGYPGYYGGIYILPTNPGRGGHHGDGDGGHGGHGEHGVPIPHAPVNTGPVRGTGTAFPPILGNGHFPTAAQATWGGI